MYGLSLSTLLLVVLAVAVSNAHVQEAYYTTDDYYSADGSDNNRENPDFGAAGVRLLYENPTIEPVPLENFASAPSAREVSNGLAAATHNEQTRLTPRNTTVFLTAWAQFLSHDITYTPTGGVSLPISVPSNDRFFDPASTGKVQLPFNRSALINGEEYEFPNQVTAWIDGSQIYGSSLNVQKALREFEGGRLLVSKKTLHEEGEYPPLVSEISRKYKRYISMQNFANVLSTDMLFACGDVRCNENPLLLTLHILFLREHNRVAGILEKSHPRWSDEKLFQRARAYVIAELQHITFNEFLFWLMGGRAFDIPYKGYNPDVSPDIHVLFSTAAFRYLHSEINEYFTRLLNGRATFPTVSMSSLNEHFFDNRVTFEDGIGPMLLGMAFQAHASSDNQFTGAVRNDLYRGNARHGGDLFANDLQRARDHGIPNYNVIRQAYGLSTVKSWPDFDGLSEHDEVVTFELVNQLNAIYQTPEDCEVFACGISEDWVETNETIAHDDFSNLGELFEAIIRKQFANIRDGDRHWYDAKHNYDRLCSLKGLPLIKSRSLSAVIRDNIPGIDIQENVFFNADLLGISRKNLVFVDAVFL